MNAPETITTADPINFAHEVLMRRNEALCVEEVASAILGGDQPKKADLKDAARMLKELADIGLIEMEPRAGGVPFYRLIAAPASEINDVAEVGDTDVVESGDSEGGETDAPAPLSVVITPDATVDFATTPELQYLAPEDYEMPPADPALLAAANRALGEQLEAIAAERDALRKSLESEKRVCANINMDLAIIATHVGSDPCYNGPTTITRVFDALRTERDDLRARLDAVTRQSIADTDALTAQIEHLRAELAERDSHLHKITSDTGRSDIAQRLIDHNDDRLYHEADMLMYEASDAITMLEHERDQLRAELETSRAEAIALKTLEGAMPGFGAEYDAQRIASLTAELQALRTCSANAINEAGRLRAELATERQAREALQEQGDDAVDVKDAAVGYLVRVPKRRPMMRTKPESARAAALSAVRSGAAHAEVLAVVPVGTARRGAEWSGA